MNIKVLSYHAQPYSGFQIGFAVVEIKGKSKILVKVCQSKSGDTFCCSPSVKLGDQWVSTLSFNDKESEKRFFHSINEQVIPLMQPPKDQHKVQEDEPSDEGLPF